MPECSKHAVSSRQLWVDNLAQMYFKRLEQSDEMFSPNQTGQMGGMESSSCAHSEPDNFRSIFSVPPIRELLSPNQTGQMGGMESSSCAHSEPDNFGSIFSVPTTREQSDEMFLPSQTGQKGEQNVPDLRKRTADGLEHSDSPKMTHS